ncbi:MAG: Hsp20/alpha crystallin family protein [Candidatus Bathyarchaeia archaeon]
MSAEEERKEEKGSEITERRAEKRGLSTGFDSLFDAFRRDFDELLDLWWPMSPVRRRRRVVLPSVRAPLMDLMDKEDSYVVNAELPGISKDQLEVEVTNDAIEVSGGMDEERREEGENYLLQERAKASFRRQIAFPEEVIPQEAEAEFSDGLLEVRVPKKEPKPPRESVKLDIRG